MQTRSMSQSAGNIFAMNGNIYRWVKSRYTIYCILYNYNKQQILCVCHIYFQHNFYYVDAKKISNFLCVWNFKAEPCRKKTSGKYIRLVWTVYCCTGLWWCTRCLRTVWFWKSVQYRKTESEAGVYELVCYIALLKYSCTNSYCLYFGLRIRSNPKIINLHNWIILSHDTY